MFDNIVPPSVPPIQGDNYSAQAGCFEGPEKLLEIWFSPSPYHLARHQKLGHYDESEYELSDDSAPHSPTKSSSDLSEDNDSSRFSPEPIRREHGKYSAYEMGLRTISKTVWDDMLAIVKCTVLNVIKNEHVDAYLLSESSMFVYPHKLILKTCGTTTLLMALPRILELAKDLCGFEKVWRVFYSRKSFMFPDRQCGPHRSWHDEVGYLDNHFENGSAYRIGTNAKNHWYLYLTSPADDVLSHDSHPNDHDETVDSGTVTPNHQRYESGTSTPATSDTESDPSPFGNSGYPQQDQTVEILMTDLNPEAMKLFYQMNDEPTGIVGGKRVDDTTGIGNIYPTAKLDSFLFEPCGYSANGLWEGAYFTIHVTPEPQCSYASFETNIPCEVSHPAKAATNGSSLVKSAITKSQSRAPLQSLIRQVLSVFQPGNFTVTLFSSHPKHNKPNPLIHRDGLRIHDEDDRFDGMHMENGDKDDGHYHHSHSKMVHSLANVDGYKRTDRILYTFEGYDLVYGHYEQLA
ncbi:hypothetical protein INT44_007713 [Umbelopsis vinacea]|uniref:Adenosylmethionine decarboxylase n=1 Tax=Umbelopsis vinacea TaxID=44442 RepID=A0A8H7PK67_9FUNG|nr:hypothetical protein INT44_007713 [Umbelopsis vinacea]